LERSNPRAMQTAQRSGGLPLALGAYFIWGLLPLYLKLVHSVPAFEFVGWRVIFTLPFCLLVVLLRRQWNQVRIAISTPRTALTLLVSALLIGSNWLIYVWAIQQGHVLASSLGYYINPLANVLAGTLFLGEKLTRRQWIAVALAAAGVSILALGALDMLWIAVSLAATFCAYGLVRKVAPVESLPGLTVESMVLLVPALFIIALSPGSFRFGEELPLSLLVALAGVVTAVPLLLFAAAARRMDYSALGFVQYLAPTLVFVEGLAIFHEPLRPVQLASFLIIWAAIAVFVWDLIAARRVSRQTAS